MSGAVASDPERESAELDSAELESGRLELAADQAIASCGGDMRSAIRALILANDYLEYEIEQILASVSKGYIRGHLRKPREESSEG